MKKDSSASVPLDREYLDKALNEHFTQVFQYMQEFRGEVKSEISQEVGDIKQQLNTMQNSMDYLVGEYQKLSDEQTAETHAHRRFDDALADHETRIVQLENPSLETQAA